MKLDKIPHFLGVVSVLSLVFLSACATTAGPVKANAPEKTVALPDESQPTSPVAAPVVEVPKPVSVQPKAPPERGSLASVINKMESSPYTLYWRDSDSYSYYVGGLLDAEYKPGAGLTLREVKGDDSGITCQFNAQGELTPIEGEPAQKEGDACSKLMFTLDDELSD